jgi:DNA-binding phage protein
VQTQKKKRKAQLELPSIDEILRDVPLTSVSQAQLAADLKDYDRDPRFVSGYLKALFVNDICRVMGDRSMSKKGLAETLGKSRQYVGRVLNETANFTIETMAEIACALGMRLSIRLHVPGEYVQFVPVPSAVAPKSNGKRAEKPKRAISRSRQKRGAIVRFASRSKTKRETGPVAKVVARHR